FPKEEIGQDRRRDGAAEGGRDPGAPALHCGIDARAQFGRAVLGPEVEAKSRGERPYRAGAAMECRVRTECGVREGCAVAHTVPTDSLPPPPHALPGPPGPSRAPRERAISRFDRSTDAMRVAVVADAGGRSRVLRPSLEPLQRTAPAERALSASAGEQRPI